MCIITHVTINQFMITIVFFSGEVFGMDMQVVSQTQFTPLPDAMCVIISELNSDNIPANLPSIESKLKRLYHGIQPPAQEIVFETLDTLIQQRKIFYTGLFYEQNHCFFLYCKAIYN